ncbi:hypothetical protein GF345_06305 [Candidatus Woesearchaeota archaeon]|nr:hypothetical protein [Candidatus Woesearchaeota archaeon]
MEPINVLLSGTGSMGAEIAKTINARDDMHVLPVAFTGEDIEDLMWYPHQNKGFSYVLLKPDKFDGALNNLVNKQGIKNIVAVEFGTPGTNNTELYAKHNIPWVSGTTGVDKSALKGNGVYDVNMALPLIAITHGLEALAEDASFKDYLKGFTGDFPESHQLYKKDPSGTRKKWAASLEKLGASLTLSTPERLEPRGHGYHKVFMQSEEHTVKPLELWAALIEYAADNLKEAFSGFNASVKSTSNIDGRPLYRVLAEKQFDLGILNVGPHAEDVSYADTQDARLANLYLTILGGGADIEFKSNTHKDRGTNMGFETRVDGRGIYMPGIMAAVKHVHEQVYEKGNNDMRVQSMMPVVKK